MFNYECICRLYSIVSFLQIFNELMTKKGTVTSYYLQNILLNDHDM